MVGRDLQPSIQLKPTKNLPAAHANLGSLGRWPGLNVYKYCALFRAGFQSSALKLIHGINWFQEEKLGKKVCQGTERNPATFSHLSIIELRTREPQPFHDYCTSFLCSFIQQMLFECLVGSGMALHTGDNTVRQVATAGPRRPGSGPQGA